jgi:aspartate aminotransferase
MDARIAERLGAMHTGFTELKDAGYPVDSINPQGAIYFSAQFRLHGRKVDGRRVNTDEEIRSLLLERAGMAVIPFQAFGVQADTGWFRLSAGAVSLDELRSLFPRIRTLLDEVQ